MTLSFSDSEMEEKSSESANGLVPNGVAKPETTTPTYCPDYKIGRYFGELDNDLMQNAKPAKGVEKHVAGIDGSVRDTEEESKASYASLTGITEAILHKDFLKRICDPPQGENSWPESLPPTSAFTPRAFYKLGNTIGKSPTNFIIIPVLLALLCGTGLQRLRFEGDPVYLFTPVNGAAITERRIVEGLFPMNYTHKFNPSRLTHPGRFSRIFVKAKDGGTVLRQEIFDEISTLNQLMHNISIEWDEDAYTYNELCAGWGGSCYENDILELTDYMGDIEGGNTSLLWPLYLTPTFKPLHLPFIFGGVKVDKLSKIEFVTVLQLNYFLAVNTKKQDKRGEIWEQKVLDTLGAVNSNWKHISLDWFTVLTQGQELTKTTSSAMPYFSVAITFMVIFMTITCMMADCVKSKPWLGIGGVVSANLGCLAAFGIVCYCDVEFIGVNLAVPFLMLGIGVDDTFVMLAAWRRTSVHDPVPKRMAETYSEAAVSISITSITDVLSFLVGVFTPFRIVQVFSLYAGIAVVATYIWHITFFGGMLALSGYQERDNRHALFWWLKTTPKSKMEGKSYWYRLLRTGGIDPADPYNPVDNQQHALMVFFRDTWATYLNKASVKALVLLVFALYLGVSCYGIANVKEGLEMQKLSLYDSYATRFFDTETKYFREYPYRIQVVVSGEMDYSNDAVQQQIENMMEDFETSRYCTKQYTESWLRSFLGYVNRSRDLFEFNITTEADFIKTLREDYIDPSSTFYEDIRFNENKTKIIGARFIIQAFHIPNTNIAKDMTRELRTIAKNQPGLNVTVYHMFFSFHDQFLLIRRTTLQCLSVAAVMMMGVCLTFIPNPLCSLWVAFSIVSIEIGVVGFMTLWGVNLDAISMMNLIMCVGFSVDFSAHISYAFIISKGETPEERLQQSFYALGLPIVQGAVSTVLGMISLVIAPSYIFLTFFKVIFLVVFIAALHGLLLLPVLLSLCGPRGKASSNTRL